MVIHISNNRLGFQETICNIVGICDGSPFGESKEGSVRVTEVESARVSVRVPNRGYNIGLNKGPRG
jgi:hypothetical protein